MAEDCCGCLRPLSLIGPWSSIRPPPPKSRGGLHNFTLSLVRNFRSQTPPTNSRVPWIDLCESLGRPAHPLALPSPPPPPHLYLAFGFGFGLGFDLLPVPHPVPTTTTTAAIGFSFRPRLLALVFVFPRAQTTAFPFLPTPLLSNNTPSYLIPASTQATVLPIQDDIVIQGEETGQEGRRGQGQEDRRLQVQGWLQECQRRRLCQRRCHPSAAVRRQRQPHRV